MKRRQRRKANPNAKVIRPRRPSILRAMIDDELKVMLWNEIDKQILNGKNSLPKLNTKPESVYIKEYNEQIRILNKGRQNRNRPPRIFFGSF